MTRAELMPELLKLSREERLIIADELRRSAEELHATPLQAYATTPSATHETREEFTAELDRRLEEMKAHPESVVTWDELDKELEQL